MTNRRTYSPQELADILSLVFWGHIADTLDREVVAQLKRQVGRSDAEVAFILQAYLRDGMDADRMVEKQCDLLESNIFPIPKTKLEEFL